MAEGGAMIWRRGIFCLFMIFGSHCSPLMTSQDLSLITVGSTFNRAGDYSIGPGDLLEIRVFGEDSVSGRYVVAPSGMIQMPLVGYLIASGMSQVQLAQRLETVLKPFVKEPKVAVTIISPQSYVVYLSGEVQEKGPKELRFKANVLQGVILGGGLTEMATGRIYLIRAIGDRQTRRYSTTFEDLLKGRDGIDFVYLERGDIVHAE